MNQSTVFIALNREIVDAGSLRKLEEAYDRVVLTAERDRAIDEMAELHPPVTAAIIGVRERIDAGVLERLPALRLLGSASVGSDHLDLEALRRRNVRVILAAGVNAVSVAEHALAMILAQTKQLLPGQAAVIAGQDRAGLPALPRELRNQRIGILGAGNTAVALLRLLSGFGVEARVWTRDPSRHPEVTELGGRFAELEEVISTSEVLSVHLASAAETLGLLNRERLLALPHGAVVVNVARREIFDVDALADVVAERPDLRFAIDDFHLAADGVVKELGPTALFSPHVAGVTQESLKALQEHVVREVIAAAAR